MLSAPVSTCCEREELTMPLHQDSLVALSRLLSDDGEEDGAGSFLPAPCHAVKLEDCVEAPSAAGLSCHDACAVVNQCKLNDA